MKISIVIDDAVMAAAMQASQLGSRQKTVELALRNLVQLSQEDTLRPWRGKLRWDGDLESMRLDADARFKSNVIKSKRAKAKGSFRAIHRILKRQDQWCPADPRPDQRRHRRDWRPSRRWQPMTLPADTCVLSD